MQKPQFEYLKYPRTPHCPWSHPSSNDKVIENTDVFHDKSIVITEKMDGENISMYEDRIHARSVEPVGGAMYSHLKQLHQRICYYIPKHWRICGEYLYAEHSIHYDKLNSYFQMFSIWDCNHNCLDWDLTKEWASCLEIQLVPIWYEGNYDEQLLRHTANQLPTNSEGYVVRTLDGFTLPEFNTHVMKYVRPNHVTTDEHWRHRQLITNEVR